MKSFAGPFLLFLFILQSALGFASYASFPRELTLPAVPDSLRLPESRASFLALHYWDSMDWSDEKVVADTPFIEQNLSNYFAILGIARPEPRAEGIGLLLRDCAVTCDALRKVSDIAALYLYSPDSPMYDEEVYLIFADTLLRNPALTVLLDEAGSLRTFERRREILKNRRGEKASDFRFIDRTGEERTLSRTDGKRRLLIFYDNDCDNCRRLELALASSPRLNAEIDGGALEVMAIEAYGADPEQWIRRAAELPDNWIVGRSPDGEIDAEEIYVLSISLTIYLLDSEGRVERKNLRPETLPSALGFPL